MKKRASMRPPKSSSEAVSRVMRANKGRDTKPELLVRKAVRAAGYRGYRTSYRRAPGRPDIAFVSKKVGIIVHGCFWHGCRKCSKRRPKTNRGYWVWKIDSNRKRDARDLQKLKREGWKVLVVWEHDIKRGCLERLLSWLGAQKLAKSKAS